MSAKETCAAFRVAGVDYALPSRFVSRCGEIPPLVPIPLAPDYVVGVAEFGGRLLPVVDAARLLGPRGEPAPASAVLVVGPAGEGRLALAVERVLGLRPIPGDGHALPPAGEGAIEAVFESAGRRIHLLHPARLLPPADRPLQALPVPAPGRPAARCAAHATGALLSVRIGREERRIVPASVGPFLPGARIEPLRTRVERVIGACRFGKRRLPVVDLAPARALERMRDPGPGARARPRSWSASATPDKYRLPAGVLVVRTPGYLYCLAVDAVDGFSAAGPGALDLATLLSETELKRMDRIPALVNWKQTRVPLSLPAPVPGARAGIAVRLESGSRTVQAHDLARIFRAKGPSSPDAEERPALLVEGAEGECALLVDSVPSLFFLDTSDRVEVAGGVPGLASCCAGSCARMREDGRLVPVLDVATAIERFAREARRAESARSRR
ncbi:MAG: chemotaxis protein CheW [Planctomycetes bacterium]|nr:chemotaxis protein CheW [Planctomycetota bacterium]